MAARGAGIRWLVRPLIQSRRDRRPPCGTLPVNVVGSLLLGVLRGSAVRRGRADWGLTLLGTGLCGAHTTFSTFGFETVRLVDDGS